MITRGLASKNIITRGMGSYILKVLWTNSLKLTAYIRTKVTDMVGL